MPSTVTAISRSSANGLKGENSGGIIQQRRAPQALAAADVEHVVQRPREVVLGEVHDHRDLARALRGQDPDDYFTQRVQFESTDRATIRHHATLFALDLLQPDKDALRPSEDITLPAL